MRVARVYSVCMCMCVGSVDVNKDLDSATIIECSGSSK